MDLFAPLMFIASCLYSLTALEDSSDAPVVHLSNGPVQGEKVIGEKGNVFFSFIGIPFAEPPLGKLRFMPPVPKKPWKDVLKAKNNSLSNPITQFLTAIDEDCLYLNVFTPKLSSENDEKMNVVYFIHGGGFLGGFEHFYRRRFYLDDVILVTVNYRQATVGFLSTNDSSARGNYGLLDQTEGLKWVKENIHHFGGDPTKVTIMGGSAGSASVMYHMLSPLSEGLFHRAIAMSGTPLNAWALQRDPLYWSRELGKRVFCPTGTSEELVECLRQKPAIKITLKGLNLGIGTFYLNYVPTIDYYFIHDFPINIIQQRKYNTNIPLIIGTTKDEGNCYTTALQNLPKFLIEALLDGFLRMTLPVVPNVQDEKIKLIKEKYFGNLTSLTKEEILKQLNMALTDGMFQKAIFRTVKEMVDSGTKTYFYRFDYQPPQFPPSRGVCHGDEGYLLFDDEPPLDEQSQRMSDEYQKLIINFVKHGSPIPTNNETVDCEWPASSKDELWMYHINLNCSLNIYDESKDPLYKFWMDTIKQV